ncbi:alpha/beta hydrolase fold domain-containing protein [Sorangium sp. So ce726]|uniref:alpha/beta hydrolase fold domain-containing protein n=1 Tax=Sorangium sp. So ce726 TaxID=3133319 RepID=UPI003F6010F8
MPQIHHPLSPADRAAMTALRSQLATSRAAPTRASFDQLIELTPPGAGVEHREARVGGVPGTWCIPPSPRPGRAILYLHGGAFILGSARAFRHFAGQLAVRAGISAFVADYRLAPEHPFPAAWEDTRDAHLGLATELGVERVAIAGDSAGGGLALALLAAQSKAPCGVLLSPWTDLALSGASIEAKALEDPLLSRAALEAGARHYLCGQDPRDPRASALYGAMERLPPVQVHVGTAEILLDDSVRLDALAGADVHVWEGMPHVFPRSVAAFEAARDALDLAGAFLRQSVDR